jgi:hypothetical protein
LHFVAYRNGKNREEIHCPLRYFTWEGGDSYQGSCAAFVEGPNFLSPSETGLIWMVLLDDKVIVYLFTWINISVLWTVILFFIIYIVLSCVREVKSTLPSESNWYIHVWLKDWSRGGVLDVLILCFKSNWFL